MARALILENVMVVDPQQKQTSKQNLYIQDGVFVDQLDTEDAEVIDASGVMAAPGLLDMHVHVFEEETTLGIHADKVGIEQGVLQVVDAGSTGINNFDDFKKNIIDKNQTEVLFFLNISKKGLCEDLSELADPSTYTSADELARFQKEHGRNMVGLKVRMSNSVVKGTGVSGLIHARKIADQFNLPIMVHIGNGPPALDEVLRLLKKGDIVTHCFHGKKGGMLDNKEEFIRAAERGVHFDIGHGNASFSFEMARPIQAVHPIDYSISTDIYLSNYETPVGSLMDTMSKCMALGVSLEEVVYKTTVLPRKVLGLKQKEIKLGEKADLTLFSIEETDITLPDSEKYPVPVKRRMVPVCSIINGRKVWSKNV